MKRTLILLEPPVVAALAILILNDHLFKQTWPSWITGKLSDFSGLFVFSTFTCVLLGKKLQSRAALGIIHVVIGIGFVLWKTAPVELVFKHIQTHLPLPLPYRVKDASDLCALVALPFSYLYLSRYAGMRTTTGEPSLIRRTAAWMVLFAMMGSIIATSPRMYHIERKIDFVTNIETAEALFLFEQTLLEQGLAVGYREKDESGRYIYRLKDVAIPPDTSRASPEEGNRSPIWTPGFNITFTIEDEHAVLKTIEITSRVPEKELEIDAFVEKRIIDPYKKKLEAHAEAER